MIYGWGSAQEVADSVFKQSANILLEGYLVFAFRQVEKDGNFQVVISQRLKQESWEKLDSYAVYIVTNGWSGVVPDVKVGFITDSVIPLLKDHKVKAELIDALTTYINNK